MAPFSFVSRSDRDKIDGTADDVLALRRQLETPAEAGMGDFPAKLTAFDSASGYYSWTRRSFDADRERANHPATVQVGTATSNPARFPNGDVVDVSTPIDVWLRPIGVRPSVGMVHEVLGPAATTTQPVEVIRVSSLTYSSGFGQPGFVQAWSGGVLTDTGSTVMVANLDTTTTATTFQVNEYVLARKMGTTFGPLDCYAGYRYVYPGPEMAVCNQSSVLIAAGDFGIWTATTVATLTFSRNGTYLLYGVALGQVTATAGNNNLIAARLAGAGGVALDGTVVCVAYANADLSATSVTDRGSATLIYVAEVSDYTTASVAMEYAHSKSNSGAVAGQLNDGNGTVNASAFRKVRIG